VVRWIRGPLSVGLVNANCKVKSENCKIERRGNRAFCHCEERSEKGGSSLALGAGSAISGTRRYEWGR